MDAGGARHLRQPADLPLDVLGGGHHQVGQFIDDEHDVGQRLSAFLFAHRRVVGVDVAHAEVAEKLIAIIHLHQQPGQRTHHLLDVGDHLAVEVRDAVVAGQLDHFGIDHHEAQAFRAMLHQQAGDDRVDANRLARTGCAGDQHVRCFGQIHHDRSTGGVATKRQRQHTALAHLAALQNPAQADK